MKKTGIKGLKLLIAGGCLLSALIGMGIGYFFLGPLIVTATAMDPFEHEEIYEYEESVNEMEFIGYPEVYAQVQEAENIRRDYSYMVGIREGFIVVYNLGKGGVDVADMTNIPICALPEEERDRLANGIWVYDA